MTSLKRKKKRCLVVFLNIWLEGCNFEPYPLASGFGRGVGDWANHWSCLHAETSIEIPELWGSASFCVVEHVEVGTCREASSLLFSSSWVVSLVINGFLSSMSYSRKSSNPSKGSWDSQSCSELIWEARTCSWLLKWGRGRSMGLGP